MSIIKILKIGDAAPKGYGFAYNMFHSKETVVAPIPLNIVMRVIREVYLWLMIGCFKSKFEGLSDAIRQKGYVEGFTAGEAYGYKAGKGEK